MKTDTSDFLGALLFTATGNDDDIQNVMLQDKTIYDFSPAFTEAVEKFIDGFRAHLFESDFDMFKLNSAEGLFGANVYYSLSGHGCGFFDDSDEEVAGLHETLKAWAGGSRFEELDCMLDVGEDGKIDLSFIPEALEEYREKIFGVPAEPLKPVAHTPGPLEAILAITKAGVIHRNETGKPQWSALDEITKLAHEALDIDEGLLQSLEGVMTFWTRSTDEEMPAALFDGAMSAIRKAKGGN